MTAGWGRLLGCLLFGLYLLPGAQAQPVLSWDQEPVPLATAVSEPQLRAWEDTLLLQGAADSSQLAQQLSIGLRRQDQSIIEPVLQRLTSLPAPTTLSARLLLVKLYRLAYQARPEPAYLQRLIREGLALQSEWSAWRTSHQIIQANEAAAIARQLFQIGQLLPQQPFTGQATEILNFLEQNLIGPEGALQHFDPNHGSAPQDGHLIANAALGLAFLTGYSRTGNGHYLDIARRLAELIRVRLEDRTLGGFYARNSVAADGNGNEIDELFDDRKLILDNALAIQLLKQVGATFAEDRLQIAAGRALAVWLEQQAPSDSPEANFALLQTAQAWKAHAEQATGQGLEGIRFSLLLPLAFLAGVLSFLSPCTLPILPAYFAVAFQSDRRRLLVMTLVFFLGLALSFSMMGATASYLGALLASYQRYLLQGAGIIIILFGLVTLIGKGFAGVRFQGRPATTLSGSFLFGLSFAIGWTACIGPILAAILVLAASQQQVLSGAVLLFVFAMGLGLPLIALSLAFDHLDRSGRAWRWLKGKGWSLQWAGGRFEIHSSGLISGLLLITLGLLMLGGYLSYLNRVLPLELQAWFAEIEQQLVQALQR